MEAPSLKIVSCHKCGYQVLSRDTFFKRNLNKRPVYCGKCGSRDLIEIASERYHIVIARKAEDIEEAVSILAGTKGIPNAFLKALGEFEDS